MSYLILIIPPNAPFLYNVVRLSFHPHNASQRGLDSSLSCSDSKPSSDPSRAPLHSCRELPQHIIEDYVWHALPVSMGFKISFPIAEGKVVKVVLRALYLWTTTVGLATLLSKIKPCTPPAPALSAIETQVFVSALVIRLSPSIVFFLVWL